MNAMAPTRSTRQTELQLLRIRLATGPAAPAEARGEVRAAIQSWEVPVDLDIADLLISELVTNAIRHEAGETILLAISCSSGQLRVDVHDTSCALPMQVDAPADAETGRGLTLVASLSDEWGYYLTPGGKAVYFALSSGSDRPPAAGRGDSDVGTVNRDLSRGSPSPLPVFDQRGINDVRK
jgi:anti-sigma regulatory factor (Ser/Thr protein kinase)